VRAADTDPRNVYSRHLLPPPKKTYNFPRKRLPNYVFKIFFSAGKTNYKHITKNFLLMDKKHRKLFVIEQSKGCKFTPKMHQNTFGGRAPPGHAGELMRSPRLHSHNGDLLIKGGRELTYKGGGREERGDGKGGEGNSRQSQSE